MLNKVFNTMLGVGKAKYVINYHAGVKKHSDGSKFYDIKVFSNKKLFQKAIAGLIKQGYIKE